jgi:hypothetical protein
VRDGRREHADPLRINARRVFRSSKVFKDFFESLVLVLRFQHQHAHLVFRSLKPFDEKKHHQLRGRRSLSTKSCGAFRRRGRLTADFGYASSAFLLVIDDYLQVTTLLGVTLKER